MTAPTEFYTDGGVPVRVQVKRDQHDIAIASEGTLLEILAELRRLNGRPSESRSSVEIDSNGSAGKTKVKVKAYGDSVEEAREQAMTEFAQAMADVELAQDAGWRAMVPTP